MEGSLTVSAIGTVTVAPDEAYVVVIPERDYGPSGPQQFSLEDRQEIVANLVAIGLNEEAVEFEHPGRYEPIIILVEVEIDENSQYRRRHSRCGRGSGTTVRILWRQVRSVRGELRPGRILGAPGSGARHRSCRR